MHGSKKTVIIIGVCVCAHACVVHTLVMALANGVCSRGYFVQYIAIWRT